MWGAHDGMGWWMVFGMMWMVISLGAITELVLCADCMAERNRRGEGR
jgi:hypothetical protein